MSDYKIIVADDHNLMSEGLSMLIRDNALGTIVAKAENGKQLLDLLNSHKADMVLMDVDMPVMNGLKAAELIKQRYPDVKVLIITHHNSVELMKKFHSLNVDGYLLKSSERTQLIDSISKIKGGEKDFPLLKEAGQFKSTDSPYLLLKEKYGLSERECEIIALIASGFTSDQISERLYLSKFTVDTHRKNIGRKTGANHPAAITRFALENHISADSLDEA